MRCGLGLCDFRECDWGMGMGRIWSFRGCGALEDV